MNETQRLGRNIKALRNAHGESQEKLGYAIGVEKNAISYYENGKREPSKEVIASIAKYYMVSVEELLYSDLSGLGNISVDPNIIWEHIDIVFPVISSELALKNNHFKKAFDLHNEVFNQLKRLNLDNVDKLSDCVDEYYEALNETNSKVESAGNILGIFYFFALIMQVPKFFKNKPSVLVRLSENDRQIRETLENPNADFIVLEEAFFDSEEVQEILDELLPVLKKTKNWFELADYYLALRYIFSLVDNDLGAEINKRIGVEFLSSFALVENPYAINYLKLNLGKLD